MMNQVFGIYFGNSTASIATSKEDGKVDILANDAGDRVTPAVVKITSTEEVVGIAAVSGLSARNPSVVKFNKRLLDLDISPESLERAKLSSPVKIDSENGKLVYLIQDEDKTLKYTPIKIATLIFSKLYSIGQAACHGGKDLGCVLCVPRHWSQESRDQLTKAAEDAQWKILQVVSETPVATLAYRLDTQQQNMKVLVYKLGGISCEATVIEFKNGFLLVRSSIRSEEIGGENILNLVTNHLAEEFKRKYHLDPKESRKSISKLSTAAESMIQVLSTLTHCSKFIESVCEGVDYSVNMSRARLEALISPLLPSLVKPIKDALVAANLQPEEIDKVILAGGPLKMPKLASYVSSLFPNNVEILSSISPDEVLAVGAAYQASYLSGITVDEPLKNPTYQVPMIDSPVIVSFSSGEEITFEDAPIPCEDVVSLVTESNELNVKVKLSAEGSGMKCGEVSITDFPTGTNLRLHVKLTLQNEVVIETDPNEHESKQYIIQTKSEE